MQRRRESQAVGVVIVSAEPSLAISTHQAAHRSDYTKNDSNDKACVFFCIQAQDEQVNDASSFPCISTESSLPTVESADLETLV
jgi:hypothetical protein